MRSRRGGAGRGGPGSGLLPGAKSVVGAVSKAMGILRKARQNTMLLSALSDFGDFYFSMGSGNGREQAVRQWSDAVDAAFNSVDATETWRATFAGTDLLATGGLWNCLLSATVVAKIAQHGRHRQLGHRLDHSLMAAEVYAATLTASLGHPQRRCDLREYKASGAPRSMGETGSGLASGGGGAICGALGGLGGSGGGGDGLWPDVRLFADATNRGIDPQSIMAGLRYTAQQLVAATPAEAGVGSGFAVQVLPLVVVLEDVAQGTVSCSQSSASAT